MKKNRNGKTNNKTISKVQVRDDSDLEWSSKNENEKK
jgi:hypothetical protein